MKQTGLMFSTDNARKNVDGVKTMTRRVIKPQPDNIRESPFVKSGIEDIHGNEIRCPLGTIGDVFWQKETWAMSGLNRVEYKSFPADGTDFRTVVNWKSAMFMKKIYARFWAEIINIKVERVTDISGEDCIKEGVNYISLFPELKSDVIDIKKLNDGRLINIYRDLWNSLNAKPKPVYKKIGGKATITHYKSYPWDEASRDKRETINGKPHVCCVNPWCWCISYRRIYAKKDN